jgi:His/Glu/Gln/Arg/opine family amino acid ABC transporter permease subunit
MEPSWSILWRYREALIDGFTITVELSVFGIIGSTLLGFLVAAGAATSDPLVPRLARAFIEAVRNVPSIIKVFFLYYVVGLDAFLAGIIGLTIHQSAYIADVVSAGLRSIPREQGESARVLGHSYAQTFVYVLLPQLARVVIPPMTNQYIEVVKNSSIVMFVGVTELTYQTQQIEFDTAHGYLAAGVVTLLYVLLALAVSGLMNLAQHGLRRLT